MVDLENTKIPNTENSITFFRSKNMYKSNNNFLDRHVSFMESLKRLRTG